VGQTPLVRPQASGEREAAEKQERAHLPVLGGVLVGVELQAEAVVRLLYLLRRRRARNAQQVIEAALVGCRHRK
jgi:hypothetical protein